MTLPSDLWHRLTEIDRAARTAVCSKCGPTTVRLRSGGRGVECMTARRANKGQRKPKSAAARLRGRLQGQYNLPDHAAALILEVEALGLATCPICRRDGQIMNIDHDHACCPGRKSCGQCARGFICKDCNRGLGQFADNVDALLRAVDYLREPPFQREA